jgi:hypothetical protein
LQPMHRIGSIWIRPNGGLSSSGTQNMQSSTGQYSTHAGDPAHPVQHSVMTASSLGFFFRAVAIPFERGSCFSSSGTIPGAFTASGALAISGDSTPSVSLCQRGFCSQARACYNAPAIRFVFGRSMFPSAFYKHLFPALLAGLALRLFFIFHFPFYSGDTAYYEELARNWLYHGTYSFYSHGQLLPSDARVPGYPSFLAAIYFLVGTGRRAVMLAQAFLDLATCVLAAGIAARIAADALEATRARVAIAALWLTVLCPFTANYTAVPLTEILATFLTTLALFIFLSPAATSIASMASSRDLLCAVLAWTTGGFVVGLGTLVRPETPLLLAAVLLTLWLRHFRPKYWKKLFLATLWMIVGLLLPLAPWATRNVLQLGRAQFLAPRYAETYGDLLPTGFYAWTNTWMFRFRDAYLFTWKLPSQPIDLNDLPSYATDSPQELSRVSSLLNQYNRPPGLTRSLDLQFGELAHERAQHHPIRTHIWVPVERAASMWFTPRTTLLPISGHLLPLVASYHNNPHEFAVTLGLALVNLIYMAMALVAACLYRKNAGVLLILVFILIRTAFLTQLQTCEPRYVLECFPALLAVVSQLSAAHCPIHQLTKIVSS